MKTKLYEAYSEVESKAFTVEAENYHDALIKALEKLGYTVNDPGDDDKDQALETSGRR